MGHGLSLLLISMIGLGALSQWVAWGLRIPAIVLFLAVGALVGPILGLMHPSESIGPMLTPMVGLAVAVILFEGGLSLRLHEFRKTAAGVRRLVSVCVVLSWPMYSAAAYYVGGLSLQVSLIFGAILVVTGPTVVIPLLRQSRLNRRTASYLKWEAIINDPVGALLAVLIFQYFLLAEVKPDDASWAFIELGQAVLVAIVMGGGVAWSLGRAFNRSWVPEYLKSPVTIACVLVVYGVANEFFDQAGLLAVVVMGMIMGNMNIAGMAELRKFKEHVSVLMVSIVFIVLTADLDPHVIDNLGWRAAALVATALFVVRPLAVWLSTLGADMDWRDRLLVAWIAPRGIVASAVAGIFSVRLADSGFGGTHQLLPLVFAVVASTVILHGFSLGRLARWLRLSVDPNGVLIVGASPWSTELARALTNELDVRVLLVDSSWHRLRTARLAGVRVLHGEVLSEPIQQSLELNEIACVLAATSNDAYNSLVCSHFTGSIEHDRVFQLPMYGNDANDNAQVVARQLRGRPAFSNTAQYEELWQRHYQDWRFYKTPLTETYGFKDLQADRDERTIPIAVLRNGRIMLSWEGAAQPEAGDIVVYYAPARADEDPQQVPGEAEAETDPDPANSGRAAMAGHEAGESA